MTTIVCNDLRVDAIVKAREAEIKTAARLAPAEREKLRRAINMDARLCKTLEERGHIVQLFDGRADDLVSKYKIPVAAADRLKELIAIYEATGMVFDLGYFEKDPDLGVEMLRELHRDHSIPKSMVLFVYSMYVQSHPHLKRALEKDIGIPPNRIISRNEVRIEPFADLFTRGV